MVKLRLNLNLKYIYRNAHLAFKYPYTYILASKKDIVLDIGLHFKGFLLKHEQENSGN